eukprot:jgi/Bigna1/88444/estExt_fgenesh1_pg.C_320042
MKTTQGIKSILSRNFLTATSTRRSTLGTTEGASGVPSRFFSLNHQQKNGVHVNGTLEGDLKGNRNFRSSCSSSACMQILIPILPLFFSCDIKNHSNLGTNHLQKSERMQVHGNPFPLPRPPLHRWPWSRPRRMRRLKINELIIVLPALISAVLYSISSISATGSAEPSRTWLRSGVFGDHDTRMADVVSSASPSHVNNKDIPAVSNLPILSSRPSLGTSGGGSVGSPVVFGLGTPETYLHSLPLNEGDITFSYTCFLVINLAWYVIKRDGSREPVAFDKITRRIRNLCEGKCGVHSPLCAPVLGYPDYVDPIVVAHKVTQGVHPGVKTSELDSLAAQTAAYMSVDHPGYSRLAARIAISNLQKQTPATFSETVRRLWEDAPRLADGTRKAYLSKEFYELVMANAEKINSRIRHERDFDFDYFGFKTMERAYLLKLKGEIVERPQYMFMRVAVGIHGSDLDAAFETYDLMSSKAFIHASPTLFHAGTRTPQLSSCFLLPVKDDSIQGIYDTLKSCAMISKSAGGIGLSVQNIRSKGSYIRASCRCYVSMMPQHATWTRAVERGQALSRFTSSHGMQMWARGGKEEKGGGEGKTHILVFVARARSNGIRMLDLISIEVFELLDLRKNHGKEEMRARDLFYGLWIPDLFMKRVETNGNWSLMCPDECPGLPDSYGEEFERLYTKYEREGKVKRTIRAQELWSAILDAQTETGTPYMLFKDAANRKSNQKNLGTIRCSNLCTEIIEYTNANETAVCNLASICLPYFVVGSNRSITSSSSTLQKAEGGGEEGKAEARRPKFDFIKLFEVAKVVTKNLNKQEHQTCDIGPMGIGVQGLADMFILMGLPFDSPEARSPMSQGIFQHDMWDEKPSPRLSWDWEGLREKVKEKGIRNSLFLAPMPTASTAQIMGYNECFEPYTSNLYVRRVKAGEFIIINPYLMRDLVELGVWTPTVRNQLMAEGGSVQGIPDVPDDIKRLYKTVWELKQKLLVDMAAERGAFIDQSQSLNAFIASPTHAKLTSMHFYAWRKGLKTGMYYLRTKPSAQPIQFTVEKQLQKAQVQCTDEVCVSCQG